MKVEAALSTSANYIADVHSAKPLEAVKDKETEQKPSRKEVEKALTEVKKSIDIFNKRLHFKIHEETKRVQVQVIDKQTGDVLEEIPPEKILDLLAAIQQITGLIVDVKA